MRKLLYNGLVITPKSMFRGGLILNGSAIECLFHGDAPEFSGEMIDCGGRYIAPGFIDLHLHSVLGGNTMDGDPESLARVTELHARHGTTSMMPSTCSASHETILRALQNVARQMTLAPRGARILGAHMEGTYFAPEMAGAQLPDHIHPPVEAQYMELIETGCVKRISAAPEIRGVLDMARKLEKRGIQFSIGHSAASYDQVVAAEEAGFTSLTHIYNAESTLNSIYIYPDVGVSEACLMSSDIRVECICDGCHLSPNLLSFIYKIKGADGMLAVTDSAFSGAPDGKYTFLGADVEVGGGVCTLANHKAFAGSTATMDRCLHTLYKKVRIALPEAVRICTRTPAKLVGLQNQIGTLAPGFDADVVVFDDEINIEKVFVQGKAVL